jgi:glycosidase
MSGVLQITSFLTVFTTLIGCQPSSHSVPQTEECNEQAKASCQSPLLLHVPSPEWQDQIIYFLMIDRFADGEPNNNEQGAGVYDPSRESHYSGGDLKGVVNNLDYIRNLGATALWTTPHVANQWWDPLANYSGYHGYWARDFKSVDEHYGTLEDYQMLSSELHRKDMYLIQDVVVNHTGNFFTYQGEYMPSDVSQNFTQNLKSLPDSAPSQYPFNLNDVNNPEHRKAGIFNWTPSIQDFSIQKQENTYQTADLDDINTLNPVVRTALKDSFGYWIREAGVDAVRIDTAKYVEKEFYEDFLHADDGLEAIAKETGRNAFLSFGEIYQTSAPLNDKGEHKLAEYVTSDSAKRMTAPIGFPLYKEISRVFAGGAPTAYMSYRLKAHMSNYKYPYLVPNFIDNHDVERFLASGNINGFKQAYVLMMTVPGIPTIYQGDEQAFLRSRRAMFAGGYLSDQDQFDQHAEMYTFIKTLAEVRKANKVFSRGTIEVLKDNAAGAGVLVYKREYQGKVAYILFNTAKQKVLLNALRTEFVSNNPAQVLVSQNLSQVPQFEADGSLTQILPAQSFVILMGDSALNQAEQSKTRLVNIANMQDEYINQKAALVSGTVTEPHASLLRVIDGEIADAKLFKADPDGNWQIDLPVSDLGQHQHTLEIYWPKNNAASVTHFYVTHSEEVDHSAEIDDFMGDDNGPSGDYMKPLDASVGCQMDIRNVQARAGGGVLELSIEMCEVSAMWAPPNEFDHVSFTIFFDLGAGFENDSKDTGMSALPIIGGEFPNQQKWDLAHMVFGWANYLYSSAGASINEEGNKLGIAPKIEVDKLNKRIRFIYDGSEFAVQDWQGVSIYITTWDKSGEGNFRELAAKPDVWTFGSTTSNAPKILDDVYLKLSSVGK